MQGVCPTPSSEDLIFMKNFKTTDGKTIDDLINIRKDLVGGGSIKGGGGLCQYTVAVVLTLVAGGASYFVISNTLSSAGIPLEDINNAMINLEIVINQSCGTMEQSAATALAKYNGLIAVDCADYHKQVGELAVKAQEFIMQQQKNYAGYVQNALSVWGGVMTIAAGICTYCNRKKGGKKLGSAKYRKAKIPKKLNKTKIPKKLNKTKILKKSNKTKIPKKSNKTKKPKKSNKTNKN